MTDVLIADDQALVRVGLRKILDNEPDMTVVGEADNGENAVASALWGKESRFAGDGSTGDRGGASSDCARADVFALSAPVRSRWRACPPWP
jgi:CheY-like chemotaxis protein